MPWPKGLSEPPSWEKRAEFFVSLKKPREEVEAIKLAEATGIPVEGLQKMAASEGVPLHEAMNGLIMASRALIDLSTGEKLSSARALLLAHALDSCAAHGIKLGGIWDDFLSGKNVPSDPGSIFGQEEHLKRVQSVKDTLGRIRENAGQEWGSFTRDLPYGAAGALAGAALLGRKSLRDTSGRDESGLTRGQRASREAIAKFEASTGRQPQTSVGDAVWGVVGGQPAPAVQAVMERTLPEGFLRKTTRAKLDLQKALADVAAEHPTAAAISHTVGGGLAGYGAGQTAAFLGRLFGVIKEK